jgi:Rieske Fe-S protein
MAGWPPKKNTAFEVIFPIYDADGDLVSGAASLDSEVSIDHGTFTDVSPGEATEIATSSGIYYLALSSDEMNGDRIATITKTSSSGAKTAVNVMYTSTRQLDDLCFPTTSGRSIDVEATGEVGINLDNVVGTLNNAEIDVDMDKYGAEYWFTDDQGGSADLHSVVFTKNGEPVTSGITTPKIQVVKASDGSDLIAETALTEVGSLGIYKHSESTNKMAMGSAYYAYLTATIGGSLRTVIKTISPLGVVGSVDQLGTQAKADVNAEADSALSDYDPPTKAELDSGLAGLNDLSAAEVNAEVDTALSDYAPATAAALATHDGKLDTVDGIVDAILVDTAEIGAAGAGLSAVPWNANWDAEVQSECADALTAYAPATSTELATHDAKLDTVDGIVDAILVDTAEIGAAGAGLSAVPWNANWDAEVQSECADALTAYAPATSTELATHDGKLDTVDGIVDLILADTGTDGVVLKAAGLDADAANEIADAILSRDVDQVEATAPIHSLCGAILKAVSKVEDDAGTLKVYRTNGSTLFMSQTVTTDSGLDPIDALAVAA